MTANMVIHIEWKRVMPKKSPMALPRIVTLEASTPEGMGRGLDEDEGVEASM